MLSLISAEYRTDFRIFCTFSTGEAGLVDLRGFVSSSPVFEPLKSPERFASFTVDYTLIWSPELDVAPEYLYYLAFSSRLDLAPLFAEWGYSAAQSV